MHATLSMAKPHPRYSLASGNEFVNYTGNNATSVNYSLWSGLEKRIVMDVGSSGQMCTCNLDPGKLVAL